MCFRFFSYFFTNVRSRFYRLALYRALLMSVIFLFCVLANNPEADPKTFCICSTARLTEDKIKTAFYSIYILIISITDFHLALAAFINFLFSCYPVYRLYSCRAEIQVFRYDAIARLYFHFRPVQSLGPQRIVLYRTHVSSELRSSCFFSFYAQRLE